MCAYICAKPYSSCLILYIGLANTSRRGPSENEKAIDPTLFRVSSIKLRSGRGQF